MILKIQLPDNGTEHFPEYQDYVISRGQNSSLSFNVVDVFNFSTPRKIRPLCQLTIDIFQHSSLIKHSSIENVT